jgi:hypothetical protein
MSRLRKLLFSRRADEFAQSAIALPVVVFITLAFLNLTMAGFASVNANNAANYGARVGSVTQSQPGHAAYSAAAQSISHANIGDYSVSVSGGGFPGAQINVVVTWTVPNFLSGIAGLFGGGLNMDFTGTATSVFRQEGW